MVLYWPSNLVHAGEYLNVECEWCVLGECESKLTDELGWRLVHMRVLGSLG